MDSLRLSSPLRGENALRVGKLGRVRPPCGTQIGVLVCRRQRPIVEHSSTRPPSAIQIPPAVPLPIHRGQNSHWVVRDPHYCFPWHHLKSVVGRPRTGRCRCRCCLFVTLQSKRNYTRSCIQL